MSGTPASAPPPPPTWTNLPSPPPRGGMVSLSMGSLSFWARALGFALLFIGTLIAIVGATPGAGCYGTNPNCGPTSGFVTGAANAVLAAKIIWSLGLFFLGAGAGLKLHWGMNRSSSLSPDEIRAQVHDRWMNVVLVLVTIVLLWFLLVASPVILL